MIYLVSFFLCVGVLTMLLTLNLLTLIKVFDVLVWVEAEISVIRKHNNAEASGPGDKAAFAAHDGCPNPTQEKV